MSNLSFRTSSHQEYEATDPSKQSMILSKDSSLSSIQWLSRQDKF